jgi:hypothetical protein
VQVVPALALAAVGQVAATALGQCARLLDEHGSTATLLARHAARSAAFYTGEPLSLHLRKMWHMHCELLCSVASLGLLCLSYTFDKALDIVSVQRVD